MVQIKLTNFNTGNFYNPRSYLNINNLSPYQKMQLVRCRIWGTTIPDNLPSGTSNWFKLGLSRFKRSLRRIRAHLYEDAIPTDHFPWVDDLEHLGQEKLRKSERRDRILLRGIKIGRKKVDLYNSRMGMFDTKKSLSPTPPPKPTVWCNY